MKKLIIAACVLLLSCSAPTAPSGKMTETIIGTVHPTQAIDWHKFTTNRGSYTIEITSLPSPDAYIQVGIGQVQSDGCKLFETSNIGRMNYPPNVLEGQVYSSNYCVGVVDLITDSSSGDVAYTLKITHP